MSRKLRVAVTGGSGRIGSALCQALVARGDEVFNLDRRMPSTPAGKFIFCDVRRRELVQPVFEQVDAVCLLGELTHPNAGLPEEVYSTNTTIGSLVLQTAADLKIKQIIYTSTCQTYGYWERPNVPPIRLPFDETAPLNPQNVYALSKTANETYARLVSDLNKDLAVSVFRFPWVVMDHIGPWMMEELSGETRYFDGLGTYIHYSDVVRAYLAALDRPRPGFEAYHFTAAKTKHKEPLQELITKFRPDYPPLPADWPSHRSPLLLEKAKSHFGWEPLWDIREQMGSLKVGFPNARPQI